MFEWKILARLERRLEEVEKEIIKMKNIKKEPTNEQILIMLSERLKKGEIKRDWHDEHEENCTELYIGEKGNYEKREMSLYLGDYEIEYNEKFKKKNIVEKHKTTIT